MKKSQCKLSVVIATHNHADKICAMLDCLKNQSLNLEIIVVNDCSTDNTIEVVENWKKNNEIPLLLINNTKQLYTLRTRLEGCKYATTDTIMFVDSDDILLGEKRLERAYKTMKKGKYDILHFRSKYALQDGTQMGEATFAAPLCLDEKKNESPFDAYCKRSYPPVLLWGKLFSRSLIEKVLPIVLKETLYDFDDKYLMTLLMIYAKSYKDYDEYIYYYFIRQNFSIDLYIRRISALLVMSKMYPTYMKTKKVKKATYDKFITFIHNRLTITVGHLCNVLDLEDFAQNEKRRDLVAHISKFICEEDFLAALIFSIAQNSVKLENIAKVLGDFSIEELLDNNKINIDNDLKQEVLSFSKLVIKTSQGLDEIMQNKHEFVKLIQKKHTRQEFFFALFAINSYLAKRIQKIYSL